MPSPPTVLLDTDVYSVLFISSRTRDERVPALRASIIGAAVVASVQTTAELLAGAMAGSWGENRLAGLRRQLKDTAVLPVDANVVDAYARLYAECRRAGHPLHNKTHIGDRWIAATAIAFDVPLFSGDAIFTGAPGLRLWTGIQS